MLDASIVPAVSGCRSAGLYVGYSRPLECAVRRVIVCEGRKRRAGRRPGWPLSWPRCWLVAGTAAAQDTRAGEIAQKQEEKAAASQPYKPSGYEKIMTGLENSFVSPPSGILPLLRQRLFRRRLHAWRRLPSVLRTRGGLGREGPVLDQELQADRGRNPHAVELQRALDGGHPRRLAGRAADRLLRDSARTRRRTIARTSRIKQALPHRRGSRFRPTSWTRLEAEVAYDDYKNEEGPGAGAVDRDGLRRDAPRRDCSSTVKYIRSQATAAIDWRVVARLLAERAATTASRSTTTPTSTRPTASGALDGELIQHLPILRENWVLSFRGRVQTRARRRRQRALLPAAVSGERQHAARVLHRRASAIAMRC